MTNTMVLAQIGEHLYGGRWKADLADDLGMSARTLRLYASGAQPVPDAVVDRVRGIARTRAEALLALAGGTAPVVAATAEARPAGMAQRTWAARCATEQRVRSLDTGVTLTLRGVGTFRLQVWSDLGRLGTIDLMTEKGRSAMRDLTLADAS